MTDEHFNLDTVQYGSALLDDTQHVVVIDSINREESKGHIFLCPHCRERMYPTFGPKYVPHFRHLGQKCKYSNYLHDLAKRVFMEEFERCLIDEKPFLLELHSPTKCERDCLVKNKKQCKKYDTITVDLAKIYTSITLEQIIHFDDHSRRPDILLKTDDGKQLWIEIWVNHETELDKREEGHIIELKINSEKDLIQFRNHHITQSKDDERAVRVFNVDFADYTDAVTIKKHNCQNCHNYEARPSIINSTFKRSQNYYQKYTPPVKPIKQRSVEPTPESREWVDLGLPSGTLWAKVDAESQITFHDAIRRYGTNVPSKEQAEELEKHCSIEWKPQTRMINMIGPNGNSISFYCPETYTHFWLNAYYSGRDAYCYHLAEGKYFWINNKEDISLIGLHLVKRQQSLSPEFSNNQDKRKDETEKLLF